MITYSPYMNQEMFFLFVYRKLQLSNNLPVLEINGGLLLCKGCLFILAFQ